MGMHGPKAMVLLLEMMGKLNKKRDLAVVLEDDERLIIKCGKNGISADQVKRLQKLLKNSSHHIPKNSWQEVTFENAKAFSLTADAVDALNKHGNLKRLEHIIPLGSVGSMPTSMPHSQRKPFDRAPPITTASKEREAPSSDKEPPSPGGVLNRLKSLVKKKL